MIDRALGSEIIKAQKHVGIVACSAEGAALCYRTFCVEAAQTFGPHAHPEVSLHGHCLADYMDCIRAADWHGVAQLMLSSARHLEEIGAELLICPDNTIHQALPMVRDEMKLPWLHIADVVVSRAMQHSAAKLGVLGTQYLMEGPVYQESCAKAGLECLTPDLQDRQEINRIIFDELVYGRIEPVSQDFFYRAVNSLRDKGCDFVALACTEIPLIVMPEQASLPVLDSTRLLARAALEWCSQ